MKNIIQAFAVLALLFVLSEGAEARGRPGGPRGGGRAPEPTTIALLVAGAGAVGTRVLARRRNSESDKK